MPKFEIDPVFDKAFIDPVFVFLLEHPLLTSFGRMAFALATAYFFLKTCLEIFKKKDRHVGRMLLYTLLCLWWLLFFLYTKYTLYYSTLVLIAIVSFSLFYFFSGGEEYSGSSKTKEAEFWEFAETYFLIRFLTKM